MVRTSLTHWAVQPAGPGQGAKGIQLNYEWRHGREVGAAECADLEAGSRNIAN